MGLWCGHAVLPFPSFDLVFLFHLLGPVGTCFGDIPWVSCLSLLFFFSLCLVSFGCGYACRVLAWILYGRFSFLPFSLDLSGLGVVGSYQSFLSCAFALTSSFSFLQVVRRPPGFGVLRRSCSFFLFAVFLSAFEITFSCRPFCFLGVEVWLSPSVFSPALGFVDSSLGSGKIRSSVFVWAVSCLASFFSACGSDRTLEFLHCEGISSGSQVRVSVCIRPRSNQRNFLLLVAVPLPCLSFDVWQLTVFFWSHLLLCFEFQFCWLLVLGLSAYRDVNLYTVFNPPVCSGSAEFLRVLYYYMVQSLRNGVTLAGRVYCRAYALDWNEDCLNLRPKSFGMRSPFGSSVVLGPH